MNLTFLDGINLTALAGIVGVLTPLLTAVVQQPRWSTSTRRLVAALVALVLGAVAALLHGDITSSSDVLGAMAAVLVSSQATYGTLWGAATQRIEQVTSPGGALEGHVVEAETEPGQHRA